MIERISVPEIKDAAFPYMQRHVTDYIYLAHVRVNKLYKYPKTQVTIPPPSYFSMFYPKFVWSLLAITPFLQVVDAGIARNLEGKLVRVMTPLGVIQARHRSTRAVSGNALVREGVRLTSGFWDYFWDPDYQHFRTTRKGSETVGEWNGYTLWPYVFHPSYWI